LTTVPLLSRVPPSHIATDQYRQRYHGNPKRENTESILTSADRWWHSTQCGNPNKKANQRTDKQERHQCFEPSARRNHLAVTARQQLTSNPTDPFVWLISGLHRNLRDLYTRLNRYFYHAMKPAFLLIPKHAFAAAGPQTHLLKRRQHLTGLVS